MQRCQPNCLCSRFLQLLVLNRLYICHPHGVTCHVPSLTDPHVRGLQMDVPHPTQNHRVKPGFIWQRCNRLSTGTNNLSLLCSPAPCCCGRRLGWEKKWNGEVSRERMTGSSLGNRRKSRSWGMEGMGRSCKEPGIGSPESKEIETGISQRRSIWYSTG